MTDPLAFGTSRRQERCGYCGQVLRLLKHGAQYPSLVYANGTSERMHKECYRAMTDESYTKRSDRDIPEGGRR